MRATVKRIYRNKRYLHQFSMIRESLTGDGGDTQTNRYNTV